MPCLAAFDLGTLLGWAISPPEGDIAFDTEDLGSVRFEGGGMPFFRFRQLLDRLHGRYCFTLVVFEEVRDHKAPKEPGKPQVFNVAAAHKYGGFKATLTAWCEEHEVPFTSVPIGTWKKALTGSGNAGKPEVKAQCHRLGFTTKTYDESDALGMLLWAEREFGEMAA